MWKKVRMWLKRPVTNSLLMKFMISLNVVVLGICWRFAYIGDIKDKEEQEYYQYLEEMNERYKEVLRQCMDGYVQDVGQYTDHNNQNAIDAMEEQNTQ